MSLGAPNTEDEIYNEVRSQLAKILMCQEHSLYNLERQSKEVSEYPIQALAKKAGFRNTKELLEEWYDDLVEFDGETIRAYSSLYDTPELQHIISLQQRTKMKTRKAGFSRRGRGGGGRGGGRAGMSSRPLQNVHLRAPPQAVRRDPPPQPPPLRRPVSPPNRYTSTGGFTVRQQHSPGHMSDASARRQASPGGELFSSSRYEQQSNRITSPYRDDQRMSPAHSERSYTSAATEIVRPEYPMRNGAHPRQDTSFSRERSNVSDYDERGATRISNHTPGPPPGLGDRRQHVEVRAERYENFAPTKSIPARTYDYGFDDDDVDPFGVDTARTLQSNDNVNVRTYHDGYYDDRRDQQRIPPQRQQQFYDDEFEQDFFIPPTRTPTNYETERRHSPARNDRYPERESGYNYRNGNGYRNERDYYNQPLPQDYDRYGHHRDDGVLRERNRNRTPDAEIFHDAIDDFHRSGTPHDSSLPKIDLPPCRQFNDANKSFRENPVYNNDYSDISAQISHPLFPEETVSIQPYTKYSLDYFFEVIFDIHCSPNPPSFNYAVKDLPRKIFLEPGYDSYSIYCVMKALGTHFFTFHEDTRTEPGFAILKVIDNQLHVSKAEYTNDLRSVLKYLMPELGLPHLLDDTRVKAYIFQSKDSEYPYFVKLNKTLKEEKEFENVLRNAVTIDMVNPYPRSLCIYYKDGKPYRAQIIAELNHKKISIELVDVGVFLTVHISDLKKVETDVLSSMPRYAIPVKLENYGAKKLLFVEAEDGFPRKSTNKTVSMILTPRKRFMSMTLD